MQRALLLAGLVICAFSGPLFAADSLSIDLSEYGYIQPPIKGVEKPSISNSRYVDFDAEGNVLVGFVVSDKPISPGTPQLISRSWRIVKLDSAGKLILSKDFATGSWNDNGIYGAAGGDFLVRTINSLKLISGEGMLIKERVLPAVRNGYNIRWVIASSPSREQIYLREFRLLEVLDSKTLSLITSCGFGKSYSLRGLSEDSMLVEGPSRLGRYDSGYEVGKICGTPEWRFEVKLGEGNPWRLLDASRTVHIHKQSLILQEHGKEKWQLKFDEKKGGGIGNHILSDESGSVFALMLRKIVGGSDFFDTSGKVVEARIMVVRSHDGKILVEAPIKPVESISPVQDFSISRDGKYLAIMDEGELRVVSIPNGRNEEGLENKKSPKSIEPTNTNGAS